MLTLKIIAYGRLLLLVGGGAGALSLASNAIGNPSRNAVRDGAARKYVDQYAFTAADEAHVFTPEGFDKPGKPLRASGPNVGHLHIIVRDEATGEPTFCRINVVGSDGNYYQPADNHLTPFSQTADHRTYRHQPLKLPRGNIPIGPIRYLGRFFYSTGRSTLDVPPGSVRIEVWKGFEYQPTTFNTSIETAQIETAEVTLQRTLPMARHGYYSGDPHLHIPRRTPDDDNLLLDLMEAEDIRFGAILFYNDPPGPYSGMMHAQASPQERGLGASSIRQRGDYHILSGQEYRSTTYGHLNLFLRDGMVLPNQQANADVWPLYGDLGKEVQKAGGYAFYAHGGFAQSIYADFVQGHVNGVELLQFAVYFGLGLEDWYHILNAGYRFPATGASDYPWCRMLGDCKTYVHITGEPTFAKWLEGAAEGRSFITTGPMLFLEVDGQRPGAQISKNGSGPHRLVVRIHVRSDVAPISKVQLIVNGKTIQDAILPADQRTGNWFSFVRSIDLVESSWVAARAFSEAASGAPDSESHTNPIYVYLDGKAPYRTASLDHLIHCLDRQIAFHKQRAFDKKAEVLAYFERSRDALKMIRSADGAPAENLSNVAPIDRQSRKHSFTTFRKAVIDTR